MTNVLILIVSDILKTDEVHRNAGVFIVLVSVTRRLTVTSPRSAAKCLKEPAFTNVSRGSALDIKVMLRRRYRFDPADSSQSLYVLRVGEYSKDVVQQRGGERFSSETRRALARLVWCRSHAGRSAQRYTTSPSYASILTNHSLKDLSFSIASM